MFQFPKLMHQIFSPKKIILVNLPISINVIAAAISCPLVTIGIWQQMSPRIQAQNTPECFMISEQGNTLDLSSICLTSTSLPKQIEASDRLKQEPREQNSIPEVQIDDPPQLTQEILRGTAALSELDAIYLRNTVPRFLEGTIDFETFEKRPRCQLKVEALTNALPQPTINSGSEQVTQDGSGRIGQTCKYRL